MLELDCGVEFDAACEEEFFAALPARPAVFLIAPRADLTAAGATPQPYLARTADLRRRLERLLRAPEAPSKRLNLRDFAAGVRYRVTGSAFEQNLVLYQQARRLFPHIYRDVVRLRPPALLKLNLANAYPRCYVTRRILCDGGFYFGPFATRRAAEAFAGEFLNLFKMRRCQIKIRRDPSFPGCIYSEMKMCLAPCFAGCTKPEYDLEVSRVIGFLASRGATLLDELEREREAASAVLDFEHAAALHRKRDKVAEVLRGLTELARKVDELDAVVLQRAAEENAVAIFAVRGGSIANPFFLRFSELASQPRSVEEILREQLAAAVTPRTEATPAYHSEGAEQPKNLSRRSDPGAALDDEILRSAQDETRGAQNDKRRAQDDTRGAKNGEPGAQDDSARGGTPDLAKLRYSQALADHLALLARWFYSRPRRGEIFFPQRGVRATKDSAAPDWPYRRMIRACSRLLA